MLWRKIEKLTANVPSKGTYVEWKPLLAKEGFHQCVYCAIPEPRFGGLRNFHVEHFRPKSKFPHLENEFSNLFFACAICNSFKGDDWPADPCSDHVKPTYLCPSDFDLSTLINVDWVKGTSAGQYPATRYMVERLYLNRPQLILERRAYEIRRQLREFIEFAEGSIEQVIQLGDSDLVLGTISCDRTGKCCI